MYAKSSGFPGEVSIDCYKIVCSYTLLSISICHMMQLCISSRVEDCFSPSLIWLGLVFCFAYYWVGQSSIRFFYKVFWENPNTVSGQLNRMRWKGVSSEPNFFLFWRLFAAWRIIRITYWRLSQHMQQIKSILANAIWPHQPSS